MSRLRFCTLRVRLISLIRKCFWMCFKVISTVTCDNFFLWLFQFCGSLAIIYIAPTWKDSRSLIERWWSLIMDQNLQLMHMVQHKLNQNTFYWNNKLVCTSLFFLLMHSVSPLIKSLWWRDHIIDQKMGWKCDPCTKVHLLLSSFLLPSKN